MKIPYRHVSIHWFDAQSSCEWKDMSEVEDQKLALCISTGFIVNDTGGYVDVNNSGGSYIFYAVAT